MRFTAPLSLDLISGHAKCSMLETANKGCQHQVLRKHLAALYGADLSNSCL